MATKATASPSILQQNNMCTRVVLVKVRDVGAKINTNPQKRFCSHMKEKGYFPKEGTTCIMWKRSDDATWSVEDDVKECAERTVAHFKEHDRAITYEFAVLKPDNKDPTLEDRLAELMQNLMQ